MPTGDGDGRARLGDTSGWASTAPPPPARDAPPTGRARGTGPYERAKRTRTRVLLIAGDSCSRQRLATVLAGHGYEVGEAPGGVVGLRMADAHQPDLILLDLEIPNMDGYEVCRALRKRWRTKQIPIVLLTADEHGTLKPTTGECGTPAWVPKSVPREGLLTEIAAALTRAHREARAGG